MKRMKRFVVCLLAITLLLSLFPSCASNQKLSESFFLMDTVITVTLYTKNADTASAVFSDCRNLLTELDALWTRHGEGGDVAAINSSDTGCEISDPRTRDLLLRALKISTATGGAFDITLAPLSTLWETCGEENRLPTDTELSARLSLVGSHRLTVTDQGIKKPAGVQIDLGGIGKGEAISLLLEAISDREGIDGGLISFGSNVAVFGRKPDGNPFRVALRDPKDASGRVGTLTLQEGAILSVSGDYERFVTIQEKNYHHILDPKTGYPSASGLSSVAIIASDGALADALSTALLVMGAEEALAFHQAGKYEFEAILVTSTGEVLTTNGIGEAFEQT